MKKYINDLTSVKKAIDWINLHIPVFSGYDKPRYILPSNNEAGDLGVKDWGDPWAVPQYDSKSTGTLVQNEFYSIIVVPANTNINVGGTPLYGNATLPAVPVEATGATDSITFTIPTEHDQYKIHETGNAQATTTHLLMNLEVDWAYAQWVGYTLYNVETGEKQIITENGSDYIFCAEDFDFTIDDRFQILSKFVNARLIYSSQGSTAAECAVGPFLLADTIADITTATFELTSHNVIGEEWTSNHYQPPAAFTCKAIRNVLFAGGGIAESRGKCQVDASTASGVELSTSVSGTVTDEDNFEDDTKSWTVNEYIGHKVVNEDNDNETVTANTADSIFPALLDGNPIAVSDPYYLVDIGGTPVVNELVTFIPDTDAVTFVDSGDSASDTADVVLIGSDGGSETGGGYLQIGSGSPAVGNAEDLGAQYDLDYQRNTRVAPWAIGAYELGDSGTIPTFTQATITGIDYYVSSINSNRSDANAGTNPDAPWETIDKVKSEWNNLNAGDTVHVEQGSVFEFSFSGDYWYLTNGGDAVDGPITLRGDDYGSGAKPIIRRNGGSDSGTMLLVQRDYVDIIGLEVDGGYGLYGTFTSGIVIAADSGDLSNINIINNNVVGLGGSDTEYICGIWIASWGGGDVSDILIEGNYVSNYSTHGLNCYSQGGMYNIIFRSNTVYNTFGGARFPDANSALQIGGKMSNCIFEHNTLEDLTTDQGQIFLFGKYQDTIDAAQIRFNTIKNGSVFGILATIDQSGFVVKWDIYGNLIYNNGNSGIGIKPNNSYANGSRINIYNNTLYNNATSGGDEYRGEIEIEEKCNGTTIYVKNNLFFHFTHGTTVGFSIDNGFTGTLVHGNNLYWQNDGAAEQIVYDKGDWYTVTTSTTYEISAQNTDPAFGTTSTSIPTSLTSVNLAGATYTTGTALNVTADTFGFIDTGSPYGEATSIGVEDVNTFGCPDLSGSELTSFKTLVTTEDSTIAYGYSGGSTSAVVASVNAQQIELVGQATGGISQTSHGYFNVYGTDYRGKIVSGDEFSAGSWILEDGIFMKITEIAIEFGVVYFNVDRSGFNGGTVTHYASVSISSGHTLLTKESGSTCTAVLEISKQTDFLVNVSAGNTGLFTLGDSVHLYSGVSNIASSADMYDFAANSAGDTVLQRITEIGSNYFKSSGTAVYAEVVNGDTVALYPKLFDDDELIGASAINDAVVLGFVTANANGTVTVANHGLADGDTVSFFTGGVEVNELQGMVLTDVSNTVIGIIESNTTTIITLASHGLSTNDTFKVFEGTFTPDEFVDFLVKVGSTVKGVVTSNDQTTLQLNSTGSVSVGDTVGLYSGEFASNAFAGDFLIISGSIKARIVSNSTSTLYFNVDHDMALTDTLTVYGTDVSGTATFPTNFKDSAQSLTDNELAGFLIVFDPLGTPVEKTILTNNATGIQCTDLDYIPSVGIDFDVYSAAFTVTNPYNWYDVLGYEHKAARYAAINHIAGVNDLPNNIYAGDRVTVENTGDTDNDLDDVEVLRIDPNLGWFEVENTNVSVKEVNSTTTIEFTRNHIDGNTSGDFKTYFADGFVGGQFSFAGDNALAPYTISWVDPVNQRMGLSVEYTGTHGNTDEEFMVNTYWGLYYSDQNNPHRWRAENVTDMSDDIRAIEHSADWLLLFCKNSLWRIPYDQLGSQPELISDNVRCPAPKSVVLGERAIMFYDGIGFSKTDGSSFTSVTSYRAKDYMDRINREQEDNIVGVYNRKERRFEFYFPIDDETENNHGILINEDSENCYPVEALDVRSIWSQNEDGIQKVFHGTDTLQGTGEAMIYSDEPLRNDSSICYNYTVTDYSDPVATVTSDCGRVFGSIMPLVVFHESNGSTQQAFGKYDGGEITLSGNDELTSLVAGDKILVGATGYEYGPKWEDFASPHLQHKVRALHIDLEGYTGELIVEHFLNLQDDVVQTNRYSVTNEHTKIVIPFRGGKAYEYGFRLRGYSTTKFAVHSIEILFDTQA